MINYGLISKSQDYYGRLGYEKLEVPCLVEEDYINATFSTYMEYPYKIKDGRCLVGSAEQSFIKLMIEENLIGKYQAVTPCFRADEIDELHQEYFIKNELFIRLERDEEYELILEIMLKDASRFFNCISSSKCDIIQTDKDSFDININGIEVGSYGIRTLFTNGKEYKWIYGTGLAEPRFSITQTKGEI